MPNYTRNRDYRYISVEYKCPAYLKAVRLPPEQLAFIARDMQTRQISKFSAYIRALISEEMERKQWQGM